MESKKSPEFTGGSSLPSSGQKVVTGAILLVMFLSAMEGMITSTIMPSVISAVGGLSLYPWVGTIFMLASTITTPLYGKLSDIYGHKRFILIAIGIFLLGSVLCGLAQTMVQLIIFRGIQGLGAGGLLTMSFIMFGILFPPEKRAKMQSLLSSVWAFASLVGPIIGAFFVETLSWRWAFFVNVPIGFLSAWAIFSFLHLPKESRTNHSIDYTGAVLFSVGGAALLYGLLEISQLGASLLDVAAIVAGVLCIFFLMRHERNAKEPIIPLDLFPSSTFSVSVILGFFSGAALFSVSNFVPIFVQGALGETAAISGRVVTGVSFGWVTGSVVCGRMLNKYGFQSMAFSGSVIMLTGFLVLNQITIASPWWYLFICTNWLGFGMGFVATSTLVAVQVGVPKRKMGVATSTVQFFRSVGGTVGLSILGGVQLGAFQKGLLTEFIGEKTPALSNLIEQPHLILDPVSRSTIPQDAIQKVSLVLANSIQEVFFLAMLVSIIGIFISWKMPSLNPKQLSESVLQEEEKILRVEEQAVRVQSVEL
ncbi:MAG: MFS transporter [Desulfobulbaceae bacterium]|nr:MFS transporter [Desulfobulbaceae bacterium]